MDRDPLEVWNAEAPEQSQLGFRDMLLRISRDAIVVCREKFPRYPISWIAGQYRFTAFQKAMLDFAETDAAFKAKMLRHVNGFPFTLLYTSRIHLTYATVESPNAYPQQSLFREQEEAEQLAWFKDQRVLIAHLCLSFAGDPSVPASARVNFLDGIGGYLTPYVDLLAIQPKTTILPVERVRGAKPRERSDRTEAENDQA